MQVERTRCNYRQPRPLRSAHFAPVFTSHRSLPATAVINTVLCPAQYVGDVAESRSLFLAGRGTALVWLPHGTPVPTDWIQHPPLLQAGLLGRDRLASFAKRRRFAVRRCALPVRAEHQILRIYLYFRACRNKERARAYLLFAAKASLYCLCSASAISTRPLPQSTHCYLRTMSSEPAFTFIAYTPPPPDTDTSPNLSSERNRLRVLLRWLFNAALGECSRGAKNVTLTQIS